MRRNESLATLGPEDEFSGAVGELLLKFPFLVAMFLLVLNDYVIKPSGNMSLLAGKLSNIAGLFAMPILLYVGLRVFLKGSCVKQLSLLSTTLVGVVFVLWESSAWFHNLYSVVLRSLLEFLPYTVLYHPTQDVSDLLCLPSLLCAHRFLLYYQREGRIAKK